MKYKLVCSDVDGTLIDDHGMIPEANQQALQALEDYGICFAITTGRMLCAVIQLASHFKLHPYIVCSNGAVTADRSGAVLQGIFFKGDTMKQICRIGEKYACLIGFNTLNGVVYNKTGHFEDRLYEHANRLYGQAGHTIEVTYEEGYQLPDVGQEVAKISMWAHSQKDFEAVWNEIGTMKEVCRTTAMKWNLELTVAGVSKWSGIQLLMEKLRLGPEEVLCIGDTLNDEEMVRRAGMGVCMGNGQQALKAVADYIGDTNVNGGVAKVIRMCLEGEL